MRLTLLALMIFSSSVLFAQSDLKIAHFSRGEIVQMMPEVKKATDDLEKYQAELQKQVEVLFEEYQRKMEYYQQNAGSMSETLKKDKEREISQLEERIQRFQQEAQGDVQRKEQQLLEPILKKLDKAVKDLAQEKGYHYILDSSGGSVLYATEGENITADVKKKLGL